MAASQQQSPIVATDTRKPKKIKKKYFQKSERKEMSISHIIPEITQNLFQEYEFVPMAGNWNPLVAF